VSSLFALHAGGRDVAVDFWPPGTADQVARRGGVGADGCGLAAFTSEGGLTVIRDPAEGAGGAVYQAVAERLIATEMIVHVRDADTGAVSLVDTHPFVQDGRAFAHDGVVGDLDRIEERLGSNRATVGPIASTWPGPFGFAMRPRTPRWS
jgi:glutamine amidotransferase